MQTFLFLLKAISDVITAGVAIISFSLFVYVITFKLRDSVTRSFTILLACVVVIFGSDAFVTTTNKPAELFFILRVQYFGLIFLPTAYFHFSDALLMITGKPSKGKRRILGYISIFASFILLYLLINGSLFSNIITSNPPAPHIERTIYHDLFSGFFILMMVLSWYNFIRAAKRTSTRTSQRRMVYLIASAVGPALGAFPYLLYGSEIAANNAIFFWSLSILAYIFVAFSIVGMTYTVSFFGFPWPDRVIKSRLFRWIMRGPVTASITLGATTMISRIGAELNIDVAGLIILGMVASIVLFEFLVTIFSPALEQFLFNGSEREELVKVRQLEDRLLTKGDLNQFLELILATLCDRLQISGAILVENSNGKSASVVAVGDYKKGGFKNIDKIIHRIQNNDEDKEIEHYQDKSIIPIYIDIGNLNKNLLGFIGIKKIDFSELDDEKKTALKKLIERAATAMQDHKQQESILRSLDILTPQVTAIQNLLASSRFDQRRIINGDLPLDSKNYVKWVKDALIDFFGGPKLSKNPLIQLSSVQTRIRENEESSINALRAVLREAIHRLRPEGERQYTNEWILYNIMDLKFIEGWKVKDISRRLALSEADYYRKQRIAISTVAEQIIAIESIESKKK